MNTEEKKKWRFEDQVHSEETNIFQDMRDELWEILKNTDMRIDLEDILYDGKEQNIKFNQCLRNWVEFPKYKYMVNFLCCYFGLPYSREERKKLFEELDQGRTLSSQSGELMDRLAQNAREQFEETDPPEKFLEQYDEAYIKKGMIEFNEDFLFDFLAPVLDLPIDQVDVLLTRILNRDKLNYYEPREFLLYLALEYEAKNMSGFRAYHKLREIYEELKVVPKGEKREQDQKTIFIEKLKDMPEREDRKQDQKTIFIKETADQGMRKLKDNWMVLEPEPDAELCEILEWHKSQQIPKKRSRQNEFEKLYLNVKKLYSNEVKDFRRNFEKQKKSSLKDRREQRVFAVTISYDPRMRISLKEGIIEKGIEKGGAIFYGEKNKFILHRDTVLSARRRAEECHIHVWALAEEGSEKNKLLPFDAKLSVLDEELQKTAGIENIRTFSSGEKYTGESRPAFLVKNDKGNGYIILDCKFGAEIPAGTLFSYEKDGCRYLFKSMEDFLAPLFCEETVDVSLPLDADPQLTKAATKSQPYDILENTGGIRNSNILDNENIRGIIGITNKKPIVSEKKEKKISNDNDKGIKVTVQYQPGNSVILGKGIRFFSEDRRSRKGSKDEEAGRVNSFVLMQSRELPARQYTEAEVEVEPLSKLPTSAGVKKNHFLRAGESFKCESAVGKRIVRVKTGEKNKPKLYYEEGKKGVLKVECEFGTEIPEGTIFSLEENENFKFRVLKPVTAPGYAEETIEVYPADQNLKEITRRSDGRIVIAETDTIHSMEASEVQLSSQDRKKIVRVTNRKPAVIEDRNKEEETVTDEEFLGYLYAQYKTDPLVEADRVRLKIDTDCVRGTWFENMYLEKPAAGVLENLPANKMRSWLMVLKFLEFTKKLEMKEDEITREKAISSQEVGAWFQQEADELLDECRLDHYYIGKPCDCFLTYLLLCSFPYDVFREIFKTDGMQRSGYREENI